MNPQLLKQACKHLVCLLILVFVTSPSLYAQDEHSVNSGEPKEAIYDFDKLYPSGTYQSPVKHPLKISGTFGELRSDHFHMGLDIKSAKGVAGDKMYSVADGFVSRISVSPRGYGNCLYIDHPNGTRSVYAHLSEFNDKIRSFVDSIHYEKESFSIDVEGLSPKQLPVSRGTFIGNMGNTGSSFGAHLHFELRLIENDAAFNPLLYPDLPVKDTEAPEIKAISIYQKTAAGITTLLERKLKLNGVAPQYTLNEIIHVTPGEIALAIKAYDRQEGTRNLNGVFRIEQRSDQQLVWQATYDTIRFEDTRYVQAHYDYPAKQNKGGYFYRMHRLRADRLPIYEIAQNDGYLKLGFGESREVDITVSDPFGNASQLSLKLVADLPERPDSEVSYNYLVRADESTLLNIGDATLSIPSTGLYADTYLTAKALDSSDKATYSRCYQIGNKDEPIHEPLTFTVPLDKVPMALRSKTYLGSCADPNDDPVFGSLTTGSTHLEVGLQSWGNYILKVDEKKPTIKVLDRYTYLISDDVSPNSALRYKVTQHGKWVLAAYDAKRNRLEIRRDKLEKGSFTVEVWDLAGNRAIR